MGRRRERGRQCRHDLPVNIGCNILGTDYEQQRIYPKHRSSKNVAEALSVVNTRIGSTNAVPFEGMRIQTAASRRLVLYRPQYEAYSR